MFRNNKLTFFICMVSYKMTGNIEIIFDITDLKRNNHAGMHKFQSMLYEEAQTTPLSYTEAHGFWQNAKFESDVIRILSIEWPVDNSVIEQKTRAKYQIRFSRMLKLAKRISTEFNEPVFLQTEAKNYEIRNGKVQ